MKIVAAVAADYLTRLHKVRSLPNLRFNNKLHLDRSVSYMGPNDIMAPGANVVTRDQIVKMVESFEAAITDDNDAVYIGNLDALAETFSKQMQNGRDELEVVAEQVDVLTKKIRADLNQKYQHDPYIAMANSLEHQFEDNYPRFDWNCATAFASRPRVLEALTSHPLMTTHKDEEGFTLRTIRRFAPHIPESTRPLEIGGSTFKSVTVPAETMTSIVDDVHARYARSISFDVCSKACSVLMSVDQYSVYRNKVIRAIMNTKYSDVLTNVPPVIVELADVVHHFADKKNRPSVLSEDTYETICNNARFFERLLYAASYLMFTMREQMFKTMIWLPTGVINPDVESELVDKGVTIQDVAFYINMQNGSPVSNMGVSVDTIVSSRDKLRARVERECISRGAEDKARRTRIRHDVYQKHIMEYVLEDPKLTEVERLNYRNHLRTSCRIWASSNRPIEEQLYYDLFNTCFGTPLTKHMYDMLGQTYVDLVRNKDMITEDDKVRADVGAITEVLMSFLFKNFLVAAAPV